MSVKLIPYTEVDGIKTLTDSYVAGLWERLEKEGIPDTLKGTSLFSSSASWLNEMKLGRSRLLVGLQDGEPAGCFWINNFQERFCQIHYFFYQGRALRASSMALEVVSEILSWKDGKGEHVFDVIIGYAPSDNRASQIFTKRIGMKKAGEIPYGIYDEAEGKSVPATIYCITREGCHG